MAGNKQSTKFSWEALCTPYSRNIKPIKTDFQNGSAGWGCYWQPGLFPFSSAVLDWPGRLRPYRPIHLCRLYHRPRTRCSLIRLLWRRPFIHRGRRGLSTIRRAVPPIREGFGCRAIIGEGIGYRAIGPSRRGTDPDMTMAPGIILVLPILRGLGIILVLRFLPVHHLRMEGLGKESEPEDESVFLSLNGQGGLDIVKPSSWPLPDPGRSTK
jgi:hypothetical protein